MYVLIVITVIIVFMPYLLQYIQQKFNKTVKRVFIVQTKREGVGTLGTKNFRPSVLTDPPKNTAFDLRP